MRGFPGPSLTRSERKVRGRFDRLLRQLTANVHNSPRPARYTLAPRLRRRWRSSRLCSRPGPTCTPCDGERSLGQIGRMPAVRGGWRKGIPASEPDYLPLTEEVITAHLSGELELGLYPMLDGDQCCWLAADFDGPAAMLDALAHLKAAPAAAAAAALEISRSGLGAHVWLFFSRPVPAAIARQLGSALLREAIAPRGRMDLRSYDLLFPSQDVRQVGGLANLIATPLSSSRDYPQHVLRFMVRGLRPRRALS